MSQSQIDTINEIESSTSTLLLTNRLHMDKPEFMRMIKIKNCCERLLERVHDENIIAALCEIVKAIYARNYSTVNKWLQDTEQGFKKVYMNV